MGGSCEVTSRVIPVLVAWMKEDCSMSVREEEKWWIFSDEFVKGGKRI